MTVDKILSECKVEGTVVKLPQVQLDRKTYQEVAKKLELIGGKWKGGKIAGFVFATDPSELLQQIANGEKRNLKKEYQFFATPAHLADKLVDMARIEGYHRVLEPSAGQGAIVEAIARQIPGIQVDCYELMDINQTFLEKNGNAHLIGSDFLQANAKASYDRIIANPPFSKNQDIDHIRHMYAQLNPGGRLVSIASVHWQQASNKKETEFREWLDSLNAVVQGVERGEFKESGTMVQTCIIIIDRA